ncbi:MFS general substrate transporter [Xylariaceae sp. FL0255]|nr:MFS general substrate transporter [Xylariaceae sp. FL0255]
MTSATQTDGHGRSQIVMVDNEEPRQNEPTERTSLFGAGAEQIDDEDNDNGKPQDEFEGVPAWRRPTVWWLLGPYLLFTLAFGGSIVPKIDAIITLICRRYFAEQQINNPDMVFAPVIIGGNNPQCNSAPVQKLVAAFTLVLSSLTGGLSALIAPALGSLSDRYGRKRLLVVASCGGIINEIIVILAVKYPDMVDYRFLVLGSFFDGITGSFTAGSILATSYVSDCTPPSRRGVAIGYLQACLFTGLALGPYIAAQFVELTGSLLSIFYVTVGCHIFGVFFFWFVLPESLSSKRQTAAREKHKAEQDMIDRALPDYASRILGPSLVTWMANRRIDTWLSILLSANPLAPLKLFFPSGRANRALRRNLLLMAFIDTVLMSGAMGAGTVLLLYGKYMFNWGTLESSRFISIVSFCRVVVLLGIFPTLNYFFRIRPLRRRQEASGNVDAIETQSGADNLDVWLIRLALVTDFAGVMGYVFVRTEELFILSAVCTSLAGLAQATLSSSVTKQIPAERVGAMLGAMGLLHALSRVFAPMIFDGIYAGTIETFPQTFIVVLASLFALALISSVFLRPHLFLQEEGYIRVVCCD